MRVVQITDLHIVPKAGTKLYGLDTYKSLQRVLTALMSEDVKPDLIIVTGDITEDGTPSSYARSRSLLCAISVPTYVLPGNHDCTKAMRSHLVGETISMPFMQQFSSWGIVCLNTQIPGSGHGELKQEELDVLESHLRKMPEIHFLIALHHTPLTPCPFPGCRLERREALLELATKYKNLRCVISGHAHEAREKTVGDTLIVTTPATSAQAWHAQEGESSNPNSFWASHYFDPSLSAYRTLDLHPNGHIGSQVHWIKDLNEDPI